MNHKIVDDENLSEKWNAARYETITRGRAKNNGQGTLDNLRRNTVYIGCEFQEMNVFDPADITKESFAQWIVNLKEKKGKIVIDQLLQSKINLFIKN